MKLSVATLSMLLAVATAYPQRNNSTSGNGNGNNNNNNNNGNSNNGQNNNGQNSNGNQRAPVDQNLALLMNTASADWMRDTGVVSNFLDNGKNYMDDATFRNQAQIAHSAEVDELTHKAVLDQGMPNNQNVKKANSTLSNGAFQLVVDQLQVMADQGRSAMGMIDSINKDRCVNVLPNIDTYMRESALTVGGGVATLQSVRPSACSSIQPGQNGALQVDQPPPGYVNGKLQNGNSNTLPNIVPNNNGNNNNNNNNNNQGQNIQGQNNQGQN